MSNEKKVEARNMDSEPDFMKLKHGENWWRTGPWKPRSSPEPIGRLAMFNPDCKHDRCSHTIVNCEECQAYTRMQK